MTRQATSTAREPQSRTRRPSRPTGDQRDRDRSTARDPFATVHRTLGNRAAASIVRRGRHMRDSDTAAMATTGDGAARASHASAGGMCHRCRQRWLAGDSLRCPTCENAAAAADRRETDASSGTADQPTLRVSRPTDRVEREADRVADRVVRTTEGHAATGDVLPDGERVFHRCDSCGSGGPTRSRPVADSVADEVRSLQGRGRPLAQPTRAFFESRLGADLNGVRIHTDRSADSAARALNARAFTHGEDVAFRAGTFGDGTAQKRRLLAHELTHVAQQQAGPASTPLVRRQVGMGGEQYDPTDDPRMHPEDTPEQQKAKANARTNPQCNVPPGCPPHFCTPAPNVSYAKKLRRDWAPTLLAGIGIVVSPRVVPVWRDYLFGGSSKQDFSGRFGKDFEESETTETWTNLLKSEIQVTLAGSPPTLTGGSKSIDITTLLPGFDARLRRPNRGMNFNEVGEIPGNLAGDIATDQTQCPVGAKPSPVDDDRSLGGTIEVSRTAGGALRVTPSLTFSVTDTVDLCPGNCGTAFEQFATVIMSQFEATGISGDVPFTVSFPAPMKPFLVNPPKPTPTPPSSGSSGTPDAGTGPTDAGPTDAGPADAGTTDGGG